MLAAGPGFGQTVPLAPFDPEMVLPARDTAQPASQPTVIASATASSRTFGSRDGTAAAAVLRTGSTRLGVSPILPTPDFAAGGRGLIQATSSHRGRNALIGGLVGAATGIGVCTAISNLVNDPGTGFSTCDAKAYLGFGLGGAAVGALIGAMIR
jgi:hypothetical protein